MKSIKASLVTKAPTGIEGFDDITYGGLPTGCMTLLVGGPGSGKTLFTLRFLANGARKCNEPGIFVAFEEDSNRIVANAKPLVGTFRSCIPKNCFFWILGLR